MWNILYFRRKQHSREYIQKSILEEMEELDDIRAYDATKLEEGEAVPFEQAVDEIKAGIVKWTMPYGSRKTRRDLWQGYPVTIKKTSLLR